MKKLILLALIFSTGGLLAQQKSGQIFYKETTDIHRGMENESSEIIAAVPQYQSSSMCLLFTENISLYQKIDEEKDQALPSNWTHEDHGMNVTMKIEAPRYTLYQDLMKNEKTEERDFLGKLFLIEGPLRTYQWKIAPEEKIITGFNCRKAVHQDSSRTLVAWFTSEIPVSVGPSEYHGLPGMILEVNIDNGARIITANKVLNEPPGRDLLQKPYKGKRVSVSEFEEIRDNKLKEMGAEQGGMMRVIKVRE